MLRGAPRECASVDVDTEQEEERGGERERGGVPWYPPGPFFVDIERNRD